MKTFSFFSSKGGVGKTTLTILLAAYLAYRLGKKVCVMDTEVPDFRIAKFRTNDMAALEAQGSVLYNFMKDRQKETPYEIKCLGKAINTYSSRDILDFARGFQSEINEDKYDYILVDFPAGYSTNTNIYSLVANQMLDLIYIPASTEAQERRAAFIVGKDMAAMGQDVRVLWNRVNPAYMKAPELLDEAEKPFFDKAGLRYSPTRIKAFNKATMDASSRCFVRNTICWPERYIQMACPELITLFEEIVKILDSKE